LPVFQEESGMAEPHIISALRDKRSELAGVVKRMELELVEHRASLTHLDATMRLFDPDLRPQETRAKQQRTRSAWFHPGCKSASNIDPTRRQRLRV
jgi:hypothetical protein